MTASTYAIKANHRQGKSPSREITVPLKTLALPDGRTLAYAEYGNPAGPPLIWCHSSPGSHREPDMLDPTLLTRMGARVIAPDRPGIGQSTARAGRRLLDWPSDLAALTAALKLEQFALLGWGGGAAYALACAWAMPHRITQVGLVNAIGPLGALSHAERARRGPRLYIWAARRPLVGSLWARFLLWQLRVRLRQPDQLMAWLLADLSPADQAALNDPRTRQAWLHAQHVACKQGRAANDVILVARPWGLNLRAIQLPIHLWHGEADRHAPPSFSGYLAEELPNSYLHFVPDEGHVSLLVRHMPALLQTLFAPRELRPQS
jgi:pimeloyl-ACP methyl ester carboxylesterase